MPRYIHNNFIQMVKPVKLVPVTIHSVEQYRRIISPYNYISKYALISNGTALFYNGNA